MFPKKLADEFARRRRQGIAGLFLFGPAGSMALIIGAFVALFFAFGFWWPYWRSGDMDMWMVYEAFIANDGLRQEYFDHPGYLTILSLETWFRLLHAAGLLSFHRLSELPPVADAAASGMAWMRATQAARLLSLLLALGFIFSFAALVRRWLGDWRIALLAAFALAFSGGLMMEARILRTELIPAFLAFDALLILLLAERQPASWRPALVALASLLVTLAMLNKIQIIFVVLTFPPIVLAFSDQENREGDRSRSAVLLVAWLFAACVLAYAAYPMVLAGLYDPAAVATRVKVIGTVFPAYHLSIALWVIGWMIVYGISKRTGLVAWLSAVAALAAGIGLGFLALMLRFDHQNVVVVMNPLEQMFGFASQSDQDLAGPGGLMSSIVSGVALLLARLTFVLSSSPRPTIFLAWVVMAACVFVWRRGERKVVFQVALLLLSGAAVDLVGTLRGLKLEYFILADPFVILAAAWLLARAPTLQVHRFAYPVGAALIVATIAVGLAEPVKHSFKKDMPLDFCVPHYLHTQRVERFSYCP